LIPQQANYNPATIIQGRYDMVCPPQTAWDLHEAWPESRMYWIPDAGHSATVSNSLIQKIASA
jgi:proline iminopeptidase